MFLGLIQFSRTSIGSSKRRLMTTWVPLSQHWSVTSEGRYTARCKNILIDSGVLGLATITVLTMVFMIFWKATKLTKTFILGSSWWRSIQSYVTDFPRINGPSMDKNWHMSRLKRRRTSTKHSNIWMQMSGKLRFELTNWEAIWRMVSVMVPVCRQWAHWIRLLY